MVVNSYLAMCSQSADSTEQGSDQDQAWIPQDEVNKEADIHNDIVEQEADHGRHAVDRSRPSNIVRRNR